MFDVNIFFKLLKKGIIKNKVIRGDGEMKVFLVRTELSNLDKEYSLIKLREPIDFAYLAGNLRDYIKDKCELELIDLAVTKYNFKKELLDKKPSLIVFQGYYGQENTINEFSTLSKNILPECITAIVGELKPTKDFPFVDLYFNLNPIEQFNETLLGIEVDRSLDEIKKKVDNINIQDQVNVNLPDRSIYSDVDKYYFLNNESTIEVFTSFRDNIYDRELVGIKDGRLYDLKDISMQIDSIISKGVYFKDFDLFDDELRLKSIINLLSEKRYDKNYFAIGNWNTIKENENLIDKFAQIGLKALIMPFEFPDDEEKWIVMGEVFDILNKYNIEVIVYIDASLNEEEEETLIYWLKERKQALVYLTNGALAKNKAIYKKLPLGFVQWFRWFNKVGFKETQRRRNYYKKYVI